MEALPILGNATFRMCKQADLFDNLSVLCKAGCCYCLAQIHACACPGNILAKAASLTCQTRPAGLHDAAA